VVLQGVCCIAQRVHAAACPSIQQKHFAVTPAQDQGAICRQAGGRLNQLRQCDRQALQAYPTEQGVENSDRAS